MSEIETLRQPAQPEEDIAADHSYKGLRRVLTYGTFDLLHYGHIRLLRRAARAFLRLRSQVNGKRSS